MVETQENYEILEKVKAKCENCHKCPLGNTRTKLVFSGGVPNNKLMLIGEAPGYWEDQKGEPFVGKAGQLLDKIFASVGLSRQKDVYICNTLKCRPPDNRNPLPEEKKPAVNIWTCRSERSARKLSFCAAVLPYNRSSRAQKGLQKCADNGLTGHTVQK